MSTVMLVSPNARFDSEWGFSLMTVVIIAFGGILFLTDWHRGQAYADAERMTKNDNIIGPYKEIKKTRLYRLHIIFLD